MKKFLLSPGYGAGWSSWESNEELVKKILFYQPLIEWLENGGDNKELVHDNGMGRNRTKNHPILEQLAKECEEEFGYAPYMGGADDLVVITVDDNDLVRINEYDGNESYEIQSQSTGWF